MRLVNTYYNLEFDLNENEVLVISVENPAAYAKVVGDMWKQVNGEEGSFVLSEESKVRNISKEVECILNPFALDCNNKKIITRLYQELKGQACNVLQEETIELNCRILDYIDKLIMTVPYSIKYNCDMDITGLLKVYGVEINSDSDGLLEKLVCYIKLVAQICGINVFVLVDIKHFLTEEELNALYETVFYEKINIVIIEPVQTNKINGEKSCIIDKDLCIIEL